VVTSTIALEGGGRVNEYPGGYDDWLNQYQPSAPPPPPKNRARVLTPARDKPAAPRKLSFSEARELQALPAHIETLEAEREQLYQRLSAGAMYQSDPAAVAPTRARTETLTQEISAAYGRWEFLEQLQEQKSG
jgi:ATP-binding cassette subfamily F protein uup